jgi:hypothetical protein
METSLSKINQLNLVKKTIMELKNLFKAIAAFQNEVPAIHEGSSGYGYSYANLNQIFKVINPLLKKHGLGFTQLLDGDALKTIIFHIESGESIESKVNIQQNVQLAKMNVYQVLGSAITYYRRYSLSAALGLITDKDTDAAEPGKEPQKPAEQPSKPYLNRGTKAFNQAIEKLSAGTLTIETLETAYTLAPEVKTELINQSKKAAA